jgi:hypothetical protein
MYPRPRLCLQFKLLHLPVGWWGMDIAGKIFDAAHRPEAETGDGTVILGIDLLGPLTRIRR